MSIKRYLTKRYASLSELDHDIQFYNIPLRVGLYPTFTEIESICPRFRDLGALKDAQGTQRGETRATQGRVFTLDSAKINDLLGEEMFPPQAVINGFVINLILDKLLEVERAAK
jgi:hypothetical protein